MKVVISLGGSLLSLEDVGYIKKIAHLIKKISDGHKLYVVVGGGRIARDYIRVARNFCQDEKYLDTIGIAVTRLNALLLNSFFMKKIPETIEGAARMNPPLIMGGTTPGHSTDAVAAMLAKEIGADRLVIATDVDGIYDKDPKKYGDAKKFDRIHISKLREMAGENWSRAGENAVIDPIACKIIEENRMETVVVNGKNLKELENAIYGKKFKGTVVEVK